MADDDREAASFFIELSCGDPWSGGQWLYRCDEPGEGAAFVLRAIESQLSPVSADEEDAHAVYDQLLEDAGLGADAASAHRSAFATLLTRIWPTLQSTPETADVVELTGLFNAAFADVGTLDTLTVRRPLELAQELLQDLDDDHDDERPELRRLIEAGLFDESYEDHVDLVEAIWPWERL